MIWGKQQPKKQNISREVKALLSPFFADRLHVVTWNVATAEPPEDVTALLQLDVQPPTDLYVIG